MESNLIIATILLRAYTNEVESLHPGKYLWDDRTVVHITEAQLLTMNSFVRKRWEKALENTKVPYTMKPSPPTDSTF